MGTWFTRSLKIKVDIIFRYELKIKIYQINSQFMMIWECDLDLFCKDLNEKKFFRMSEIPFRAELFWFLDFSSRRMALVSWSPPHEVARVFRAESPAAWTTPKSRKLQKMEKKIEIWINLCRDNNCQRLCGTRSTANIRYRLFIL